MREVVRAVTHTAIFTRAIGPVVPRDAHCELIDGVCFSRAGAADAPDSGGAAAPYSSSSSSSASARQLDAELDARVEAHIDALARALEQQRRRHRPSAGGGGGGGSGGGGAGSGGGSSSNGPSTAVDVAVSFYDGAGACWEAWVLPLRVLFEAQIQQQQQKEMPSAGARRPPPPLANAVAAALSELIARASEHRDHIPPAPAASKAPKGSAQPPCPFPFDVTFSTGAEGLRVGLGGVAAGGGGSGGGSGGGVAAAVRRVLGSPMLLSPPPPGLGGG